MSKFTPGPWTLGVPSSVNHNIFAGEQHIAGVSFKKGRGLGDPQPEDYPNALLIAAAPELYEALKALVERCHIYGTTKDGKMLERARAALAKAVTS
jgi:hypothetical protein